MFFLEKPWETPVVHQKLNSGVGRKRADGMEPAAGRAVDTRPALMLSTTSAKIYSSTTEYRALLFALYFVDTSTLDTFRSYFEKVVIDFYNHDTNDITC